YSLGLISKGEYERIRKRKREIKEEITKLKSVKITPNNDNNGKLKGLGTSPIKTVISLAQLLRRPELSYQDLAHFDDNGKIPPEVVLQVEIEIKYENYMERQREEVERFKRMEEVRIPTQLNFNELSGLSNEVKEKLSKIRPVSLGQASRISGVTPAAISILMVHLKKRGII
ncbi:tRNA uridine-5-carboxymethylaminomethyl(34) synthesis enzyme MnmG, partial [bacterium]|nr:tRNA uridine-5-carboxymethylaminomethyl(34) synthesis enzyme MnmG [bacterium]